MLRTRYLFFVITAFLFFSFGCGKDNTGNPTVEITTDVKEKIELASSTAGDYFGKCSSINELQKYLEDIKKINGVKSAYISGNALFVEIDGWGKVAYLYPTKYDDSIFDALKSYVPEKHKKPFQTMSSQSDDIRYSICLADQVSRNDDFKEQASVLSSSLTSMCYDAGVPFVEEDMTVEWIFTKMLDYDAVILHTHGCYDQGQHWIATANEIGIEKWVDNYSEMESKLKPLADSESMAMCIQETRDGEKYRVWYIAISEKAIDNIPGHGFSSSNPHIVFNTACESLKSNEALADAFIHQGANYYFGFNGINSIAPGSAWELFRKLTRGESIKQAIESMTFVRDKDGAVLICKEDGSLDISATYILPPFITTDLNSALGRYLPINRGYNPPIIEGDYIVNPIVYLYDSSYSHYAGQRDSNPAYFRLLNQDNVSCTIQFEEKASGGIEYDYGSGQIYGNGNNFTIISPGIVDITGFKLDSNLDIENYNIIGEGVWIISGTKVGDSIEGWQYGWIFTNVIQDRPEGGVIKLPEIGTVMVFKDGDEISGYYPFPS